MTQEPGAGRLDVPTACQADPIEGVGGPFCMKLSEAGGGRAG
jgi:hypothetical protein